MGAIIPFGLISTIWPVAVWLMLATVLFVLALAVADYRFLIDAFNAIRFKRTLPNSAGRGASCNVGLELINIIQRRLSGSLRDLPPEGVTPETWQYDILLEPNGAIQENYSCIIPERGVHHWGLTHLRLKGFLGFLEGQMALGEPQSVKVYPESAVPDGEYQVFTQIEYDLKKSSSTRRRGEGMDFETIDRFVEGDDPRHIDWFSTARSGEFMVRRYQQDQHREVVILLDCGRLMGAQTSAGNKLDRAVDAALLLFRIAGHRGDSCSFGVYDNQVRSFLLPQRGIGAYKRVLENVYDVECSFIESDFSVMFSKLQQKQRKRSLVVIISDVVDSNTSGRMKRALAELKKQHMVVFAAMRTPALSNYANQVVDSTRGVMRQAVAMQLEQEREKALHQISKLGVTVLDTEPEGLTVPLLNQYIRIREQGLL
ncbi:DUF58 domain-containing protein [Pseudodesulfovibrio sediminis]|uniref:Membrane protein n=1 Tax=Pseudodesulfovibrio sediminis TaxID=2810563 RepID=A0ABN6EWK1_9BACT|nr:DUF58 domain-containing protein [Pseudodesulfovibrio sediminis]BCS89560.1 membrane protein [Pseudodesulfovibrio sediminis]